MKDRRYHFGKTLNLILKPTNACNMRCSYCYHYEKGYGDNRMSLEMFDHICSTVLPFYDNITMLWHGGEPMLMGIEFYIEVFKIINSYLKLYGEKKVKFIFQTNLTLINKDWLDFFKYHHIYVGTSFDGLDNEITRGRTREIIESFALMKKADFPIKAICVITPATLEHIFENYNLFKQYQIDVKFNPVFKTNLTMTNSNLLESEAFIKRIIDLYEYWFFDKDCQIMVEPFMDFSLMAIGQSRSCTFKSCLLTWLSIDWNGEITPCGRNYSETYNLGNITSYSSIQEAFLSSGYRVLLSGAIKRREYCKENCLLFNKCHGGCNNDALLGGDITRPNRFYCEYYIRIIGHINSLIDKYSKDTNLNAYIKNIMSNR